MEEQSDTPRQTPLVELLLAVPEDARLIYEHSPTESQSIPVGPMCRQAAMELATATRERDEARALNVEWSKKAETWMASPEAAQRLQGYRELGQQVAKAQNERDEARAEVERLRSAVRWACGYDEGAPQSLALVALCLSQLFSRRR